jgi:hypothetical protein
MSRNDWAEIIDLTARRYVESTLGVKFPSKAAFNRYCAALATERQQEEIDQAIWTLESNGYTVTKKRGKK